MTIIQISDLKKSFHGKEVIKGLSFSLEKGKCTALIGPNGAGKTTTLKMLSGLSEPSEGVIEFSDIKKGEDFRHLIGFLPQFPVYYHWMTGLEFLVYVGKLAGLSKGEAKEKAHELLQVVGISDAKNQRIGKYSGGMKQRLGIAQSLIHHPELLILDEPVSALDPFGRKEVLELLEELKKEATILFSTHILNDAEQVCDEILFLHNGLIVERGTMDDLKSRYQQSKIDVIFQQNAKAYSEILEELEMVESLSVNGNKVTVSVNDLEQARNHILNTVMVNNLPLLKFEISSMTLEDVFMKVVGK